jgi:hypothetical protein
MKTSPAPPIARQAAAKGLKAKINCWSPRNEQTRSTINDGLIADLEPRCHRVY